MSLNSEMLLFFVEQPRADCDGDHPAPCRDRVGDIALGA
ncbi:hypothetical protein XCR_2201 [Xanthomonas campestris pv. raphani 756C]|nr:hypothetical protein XCR_2201 [Xanthomonas campestris pv. raphani 756C]